MNAQNDHQIMGIIFYVKQKSEYSFTPEKKTVHLRKVKEHVNDSTWEFATEFSNKLFVHPKISLIYVYDCYQTEPFCYVKKSDGKVI